LQLFFEGSVDLFDDLFVLVRNFRYSFHTVARRFSPFGWFLVILLSWMTILGAGLVGLFLTIPSAKDLDSCITTKMYRLRLCKGDESYVPLKQISTSLQNAVIVSEDGAFWEHQGIDWVELRKSFETNLEKGRFARGGSTITQQLAKNVYLYPEKSLWRKAKEAIIATRIERQYSKKIILEKYLNVVEFDKGVYGVKQAASHYFDKRPSELTLAESAWLAFLLPNPRKYSASFHRDQLSPFALKQMLEIIDRLARYKKISEEERLFASHQAKSLFGGVKGEGNDIYEEFLHLEREEGLESVPDSTATESVENIEPEPGEAPLDPAAGDSD
jgi:monofunctional glycosyltransferase